MRGPARGLTTAAASLVEHTRGSHRVLTGVLGNSWAALLPAGGGNGGGGGAVGPTYLAPPSSRGTSRAHKRIKYERPPAVAGRGLGLTRALMAAG